MNVRDWMRITWGVIAGAFVAAPALGAQASATAPPRANERTYTRSELSFRCPANRKDSAP